MYYVHNNFKWAKKIERGLNLIFPMSTYCILCGNLIDDTRKYSLCDYCIRKVKFSNIVIDLDKEAKKEERDKALNLSISCMNYGVMEREIGASLKYSKNTYIARIIAEIMYDRIMNDEIFSTNFLSSDYIIPVPISKERLKERGFNQTEKIGKYLSKKIGVPLLKNVLIREKDTIKQAGLNKLERKENLEGAFKVKGEVVKGKAIILVDDFYTTGITAYECAKILKMKGASEVNMISLASGSNYKKRLANY